jgi:RNA polymerase sigma-70 factor (ECF subfamily)
MLVQSCLSGDTAAFGDLVDAYEGKLYNLALQITGSQDDAMDVTQSAFVKAYEKLHTFDPGYRFFSWVYRIAVNEALNLISRRRREAKLEFDTEDLAADPEQTTGDQEIWHWVGRALDKLSPDHRAVIVLKHFQGMSYREIAQILDIPEKRVKSRLFTARRKLRETLVASGVAT